MILFKISLAGTIRGKMALIDLTLDCNDIAMKKDRPVSRIFSVLIHQSFVMAHHEDRQQWLMGFGIPI